MATNRTEKLPAVAERGSAALIMSVRNRTRVIALIGQALDVAEARGDIAQKIADEISERGIAALKDLMALLPAEQAASASAGAALAGLAGVFAGAAAAAAGAAAATGAEPEPEPEPVLIDVTPGVQDGASDTQPIDW
jgi:hypothetical protein